MKINFRNIMILLSLAPALASCGEKVGEAVFGEKIVVEGFIEEGRGAVVWLTKSMFVPYDVDQGLEKLRDIPIRWARVAISDGEQEEVLIGGRDADHLLEYSYRGYDIKGEAGREYTLTVNYSGFTLTAVTTIPAAPAEIGEITVTKNSEAEGGLYQVNTIVRGVSGDGRYMLMAKPAGEGVFRPCLFGTVDGAAIDGGDTSVAVFRPMGLDIEGGYYPTYRADEQIMLRLASIDGQAFDFWSSYMNEVINARNPIYPSTSNLKSNIRGGGLGVWYGFSAAYGDVDMSEYAE